ncbi:hypothetical protein D3C76_1659900 [compost metagenome]
MHPEIRLKIAKILADELLKSTKSEKRITKKNTKEILEIKVKLAELELAKFSSRGEEKLLEIQNNIEISQQLIYDLQNEIEEILDQTRKLAITLASFI